MELVRQQTIRAIETRYRGYRFRSRLEARWAVFFQTLGVRWQYEPEGFVLSTGKYYLPDFLIHLKNYVPLWVEVKPSGISADPFEQFMKELEPQPALGTILREIPDPEDFYCNGPNNAAGDDYHLFNSGAGWADNLYQFCVCEKCAAVGFEFEGRSERIKCSCADDTHDKGWTADHPKVLAAYASARAARFEARG